MGLVRIEKDYYIPYCSTSDLLKIMKAIKRNPNLNFDIEGIKKEGIGKPNEIYKIFEHFNFIAENNKLSSDGINLSLSGEKYIKTIRNILENEPYAEFLKKLKEDPNLKEKQLKDLFRMNKPMSVDPLRKSVNIFLYFVKEAEISEVSDREWILNKKFEITPGTKKGKTHSKVKKSLKEKLEVRSPDLEDITQNEDLAPKEQQEEKIPFDNQKPPGLDAVKNQIIGEKLLHTSFANSTLVVNLNINLQINEQTDLNKIKTIIITIKEILT